MIRKIPSNKELEKAILGALIVLPKAWGILSYIDKHCFSDKKNKDSFVCLQKLHESGEEISSTSLVDTLIKEFRYSYKEAAVLATGYSHSLYTTSDIHASGQALKELSLRREVLKLSQKLQAQGSDESVDILKLVEELTENITQINDSVSDTSAIIPISLAETPDPQRRLLKLGNRNVLFRQELMCLVARAGAGKSQTCEAIAASWINKDSDTLGFKFVNTKGKLLYIDTERSRNDCISGIQRIRTRVGEGSELYEKSFFKYLDFYNFKEISDRKVRQATLKRLLETGQYGMLILDGSTDFIYDPNDAIEGNRFIDWLIKVSAEYNLGVINTIHDNPSPNNKGKARGHFGSELLRKSQSVLWLSNAEDSNEKIITTKFEYGKNRNDRDDAEVRIIWDDDKKMFITSSATFDVNECRALILKNIREAGTKKTTLERLVVAEFPRFADEVAATIDELVVACEISIVGNVVKRIKKDEQF